MILLSLVAGSFVVAIIPGWSTPSSRVTPATQEELVRLQRSVSDLQGELNRGRDQLEADRRVWAERERNDPIIAAVIQTGGLLFACLLPIIAVTILLWPRQSDTADAEICDLLLTDAAAEHPRLLTSAKKTESPERVRIE